jgi:exonuclease III
MNINTDESDCIVVQKGGKGGGDVGSKIRGAGAGFERGEGESGVQSLRGEEEGTQGRAEALEGGSILLISAYDPRAARDESQRET